jgi:hypothetical protein
VWFGEWPKWSRRHGVERLSGGGGEDVTTRVAPWASSANRRAGAVGEEGPCVDWQRDAQRESR